MLCHWWAHLAFNALLGAPVALMEQLQAIVLPKNAHNTATSGLFKKFKVSDTRALSLTPWDAGSNCLGVNCCIIIYVDGWRVEM